jgi:Xaa-Pro aminopeptidase
MRSVFNRIRKLFDNTEADVIFLMNMDERSSNFNYLTVFTGGVFERNVLIVTRRGLVLPVPSLEYEIAKEQRPKEMKVVLIENRKEIDGIMKAYMSSKVVGIDETSLPYVYYAAIKRITKPKRIIDVSMAFNAARSVKEPDEIRNIRIACRITKSAIAEARGKFRAGMTEKEAAALLDYTMMKKGADGTAFTTNVSFGRNSALPHHSPDNTKLTRNCIVLIDIGAKYNNYCSDITRTFMFRPDKSSAPYRRFSEMHGIVARTQAIANGRIGDGVSGGDVNAAATEYITTVMNGKYKNSSYASMHMLGHPIGLDVHDFGTAMGLGTKRKLKANMVVSNEPGIYIVGFGGVRIEDDIIVTKSGKIVVT